MLHQISWLLEGLREEEMERDEMGTEGSRGEEESWERRAAATTRCHHTVGTATPVERKQGKFG